MATRFDYGAQKLQSESRASSQMTFAFLSNWCFYIAVVLIPLQNTALQNTPLRFLGASPTFIPLSVWIILGIADRLLNSGFHRRDAWLLFAIVWCVVLSLTYLAFSDIRSIYDEAFLTSKLWTYLTLNLLILVPVFNSPRPSPQFRAAVLIALVITIAGYVSTDILNVGAVQYPSFFQFSPQITFPRGFSLELSTFASTAVVLGLLGAFLAQAQFTRNIYYVITAVMTVLSLSKGAVITVAVSFFVGFILTARRSVLEYMALAACVAGVAGLIAGPLFSRFEQDYNAYTSTSTRSALVVASVISAVENPIGVGYTGYIPRLSLYTPDAVSLLSSAGVRMNPSELYRYLRSPDAQGLSVKSLFFEYLIVFGILGFGALVIFHFWLIRRVLALPDIAARRAGMCLLTYMGISLLTYMPVLGLYAYPIAYGTLVCVVAERRRILRPGRPQPQADGVVKHGNPILNRFSRG